MSRTRHGGEAGSKNSSRRHAAGWTRILILAGAVAIGPAALAAGEKTIHWPSFRGPGALGVGEGFEPPTSWNVPEGKGVLWKTAVPGLGHASPVIWGDRLFVVTAVGGQADPSLKVGLYGNIDPVKDDSSHKWIVMALDKRTGKVLWEKTAHEGVPKVKRHTKATHANSTPATDGKHLAVILGSEGLFVFDLEGKLLWRKDLGPLDAGYYVVPEAQWGFGSSPLIHKGRVIVQCDVQKGSFLAAFDLADGREVWRVERTDVPTWSTPAIVEHAGTTQVVVNGHRHAGGYEFGTGKEIWKLSGGGDIPVPTPIFAEGHIYFSSAHGSTSPVVAVRPGARGDISLKGEALANDWISWSVARGGAYMQTPIAYGGHLYVCRDNGVVSVYSAATGERLNQGRLGDGGTGFTASAVAAAGKLYYTAETGDVLVVRAGPELEVLATNPLGEEALATPALSDGSIYFRTRRSVIAIGPAAGGAAPPVAASGGATP